MSGGWTAVDSNTNKSIPVTGTNAGGAVAPYVMPSPMQQDAVGKMRISQPTSLIDTDFEYGPQPSKWESICLQNNRPTQYYDPQSPLTITSLFSFNGNYYTQMQGTFTLPSGALIYVQNSLNPALNGWCYVVTGGTNSVFIYSSTLNASSFEAFSAVGTYVYVGYNYSLNGFYLQFTSSISVYSGAQIQVTTLRPHGLSIGSLIYILGTTSTGTTINGPQVVNAVDSNNTFRFTNIHGSGVGIITCLTGQNNVFPRAAGYVESRPYDGGVAFSAGSIGVSQQLIRQTRRYFRYQSGKSLQFSTGTSLCPSLFVTSITASGTTATVTTRFAHNLSTGCRVVVTGCDQGAYNGTYQVASVPSATTFTYTMVSSPASPATGFPQRVNPISWAGASNRVGMFDQQNGMFFEYDGSQLYAVWRSSVLQLNGTVQIAQGDTAVFGTGTQFLTQLDCGDFIVIRGQTHRVLTIDGNTTMYISPEYRGTSVTSNGIVSKTVDTRVPQSQWNLDRCDGTGPSGYRIDLTRMQMFYMDYSWYGAGVIRWGVRATNGQIIWCHQQQNNNRQYEAYLRSGNLPAHYESNGIVGYTSSTDNYAGIFYPPAYFRGTSTTSDVSATATTIPVTSSFYLPTSGVVLIGSEFIYYANNDGFSLTGCVRGLPGGGSPAAYTAPATVTGASLTIKNPYGFPSSGTVRVSGAVNSAGTFTWSYTNIYRGNILYGTAGAFPSFSLAVSSTTPMSVEYASPDTAAPLAHWGSSVIMDGGFDDDKSLVFNYGTTTPLTINASSTTPLLAIRLAPSADNGTIGLLGAKETINRGQLQLLDMAAVSTGPVLINLILNGYTTSFSGSFVPVNIGTTVTSSLAQVAVNTSSAATITGGESVTALYANGVQQIDLSQVRDLGNSITGGGLTNTVPTAALRTNVYPDGPDVLYVVATNTSTTTAITLLARLNWKEAQA